MEWEGDLNSWDRLEMHTEFSSKYLKGRDHSGYLSIDRRINIQM
jgi:hypothetical protein